MQLLVLGGYVPDYAAYSQLTFQNALHVGYGRGDAQRPRVSQAYSIL